MADALKEAIRFVIETEGREGIDALRKALAGVGDVSAETVADTDKLLDSLVGLNDAAAKATRFQQLTDELEKTTQALDHASREAIQFGLELAETEKPSKRMQAEYRSLREEVTRLEGVQKKQAATQEKVGNELREAGVDATKLANAERTLRTNVEGVTAALQKQVGVIDAEVAATRRQKQATADADDAFRKFIQSGTASADALNRYKASAEGAAAGSRALSNEGGRLQSLFGGLRNLIAPVLAYLSFNTAIQGIKNLAGIGAAAEDAKRALVNLYGSTAAGTRAYEGLRDMARNSGLAFADLVNDAKKLKAFGLDPLNGSLQALIDQNAAVGGSQQDLSGKVLALGQAWAKQKLQGEEILQLVERGVPVWDLLQKSTGKNVQELQKLSEQGKLGRDVIKGLYEEIGRANTGAAERGLGSLSGLVAQATARWEAFRQKVADSGVTEYLKKQVQSLLGSTGDMDALAKRVADGIIGTLEALKRFGAQLAPIGQVIGDVTLALVKHAEVVAFTAKAYALLKITNLITGYSQLARATTLAGDAAGRAAQQVVASQTAVGRLGSALRGLPGLVKIGVATIGIDLALQQFVELDRVLKERREFDRYQEGIDKAKVALNRELLEIGRQQQAENLKYRDTVIQSGLAVSQMTNEQAAAYQTALQGAREYFGGVIREARATGDAQRAAAAHEQWDQLGEALGRVKGRLEDLGKASQVSQQIVAAAQAAGKSFDELVAKGKTAAEAVNNVFEGINFVDPDASARAIAMFAEIEGRSDQAAVAIRQELSGALNKVAVEDLPKVKGAAEFAFDAGVKGAKSFMEAVASINLQRLGVDINAIKTGFTAAGKSAVDAFKGAVKEVDDLGLTVEQKSRAIAQAFDNAFKQASTKAELQALKVAIQDALASGDIGFAEFQQRVAQVDAKLAEVGGTGKQMGAEVASGANQASGALGNMSNAADSASTSVSSVGDAAQHANQQAGDYGKTAGAVALTTRKLSDAAYEAYRACNKLAIGLTGIASQRFAAGVNRVTAEIEKQGKALDDEVARLEREAEKLDENYDLIQRLRQQYKYLAEEEIQRLIAAELKLKQAREAAADAAQRDADAQADAYERQMEAYNAANGASGAAAAPALTQRSNRDAQATAAAATQLLDSAASAASAINRAAVTTDEITLRVITTPDPAGVRIQLSPQQLQDIAAAVVRMINQSRSVST